MDIDEGAGAESASAPRKRARKDPAPKRRKDPKAPKLKRAIEDELRAAIKGCVSDGRKCAARLKLVAKQANEIGNTSLVARAVKAAATLTTSFSTVGKAFAALKSVKQLLGL